MSASAAVHPSPSPIASTIVGIVAKYSTSNALQRQCHYLISALRKKYVCVTAVSPSSVRRARGRKCPFDVFVVFFFLNRSTCKGMMEKTGRAGTVAPTVPHATAAPVTSQTPSFNVLSSCLCKKLVPSRAARDLDMSLTSLHHPRGNTPSLPWLTASLVQTTNPHARKMRTQTFVQLSKPAYVRLTLPNRALPLPLIHRSQSLHHTVDGGTRRPTFPMSFLRILHPRSCQTTTLHL